MKITTYKNYVIKRRTQGRVKQANLLAKTITAYEKSQITSNKLLEIFNQLTK